jgi:heme-degrading monooxygenase HmoA
MNAAQFVLAQFNVAHFKQPREHPQNKDFIDNLEQVNAAAKSQPGYIWHLEDDESVESVSDTAGAANTINNLSVWEDAESLAKFVYQNTQHRTIMRRREEWFKPCEVSLVLWWIPVGHIPTIDEATMKLALLEEQGPTAAAFTFKQPFPTPVMSPGEQRSR